MNDPAVRPAASGHDDVEIITTIPTRRSAQVTARAELVAWCLRHQMPVPPARERRCQ